MTRKTTIYTISMIFWLSVCCLAQTQQNYSIKDMEIARRTHYKPLSEENFQFPTPQQAIEVFTQGKELLLNMDSKTFVPFQNNFNPIPKYTEELSDSFSRTYNQNFKYYQEILQSDLYEAKLNKDLKHYQDFYKQIVWKEDGSPDLTKAATLKSYLAFYNLIHNNGKPSRLQVGRIDEHFPLLGTNADAFTELQEKFGNNDAYLWLTYELYNTPNFEEIIPLDNIEQTEYIAKQILYNKMQKYGITPKQTDQWLEFATTWQSYEILPRNAAGGTVTMYYQGNWYCTILLKPRVLQKGKQYFPLSLIAVHEFQHVKDRFPGLHNKQYSLSELTTSISDLIIADEINHRINNIPYEQSINYKQRDNSIEVNIGEIAWFFRNMSQKYNTDNYAELLLKPEATKYIENIYNKFAEDTITSMLEKYGEDPNEFSKEDKQKYGREALHPSLEEIFKDTNRGGIFAK